jgi:DNA-binding MarR family transcriptional regulator
MTIEEVIKSTVKMDNAKKVILNIMYTYNVLRILRGQKGNPANMCVIQERMLAKTSNTTRLVDKLLLKEFVTRNVCPGNRRKIEVLITQKGLDVLKELDPKVDEHERTFAENISPEELELLNTLLEKYRTQQN